MDILALAATIPNPGVYDVAEAPNHLLWFVLGAPVLLAIIITLVVRTKLNSNDKFGAIFGSVILVAAVTFAVPNIWNANEQSAMDADADAAWTSAVRAWINDTYAADATATDVRALVRGDSANLDLAGDSSTVWMVGDEYGDLVITGQVPVYMGD